MLFICLIFNLLQKNGHSQTTTIILTRHAEKDTSASCSAMMKADPPLSVTGKRRAEKLSYMLKNYRRHFFASNYP